MKIDKYIAALTKLRQDHGPDLEVVTNGNGGPFKKAPLPRLRYRMTGPNSPVGQEFMADLGGKNYFHIAGRDPDRLRGDKVVSV